MRRIFTLVALVVAMFVLSCTKKDTVIVDDRMVDLGLSVKWASCNVGATAPEDYGDYFSWGEIVAKLAYYDDACATSGKPMSDISGNSKYDAARANWGKNWRMPTAEEQQELLENCSWEWTTLNGVGGMQVTGPNGNSIFLPAAGFRVDYTYSFVGSYGSYWSSTPQEVNNKDANIIFFGSSSCGANANYRYYGLSVRPVSK
jgi:hypothetical protein